MKSVVCYSAVLTLALGLAVDAASTTPTTPTKPTTPGAKPVAERTYPQLLPLTLEVAADEANELGTLREFTITAQREGDYAPVIVVGPVNPFTGDNLCKDPMPKGITGCAIKDDNTAAMLRIDWQVPEAGIYRLVLSGKRGTSDRVQTIGAFDLEARD
jgi:hypothetical protein